MVKIINNYIDERIFEIFDFENTLAEFVFKNINWETIIFDGIPFYYDNGKSLQKFKTFLESQKSRYFILHGQNRMKFYAENGEGKYTKLTFEINNLLQSDFVADIEEEESFNSMNWFAYSEIGNWGIYIDTELSIFVIGFDKELQIEIIDTLKEEEIISTKEDLKEKLSDSINDRMKLNEFLSTFSANYLIP